MLGDAGTHHEPLFGLNSGNEQVYQLVVVVCASSAKT
jgi:hypothetical protein